MHQFFLLTKDNSWAHAVSSVTDLISEHFRFAGRFDRNLTVLSFFILIPDSSLFEQRAAAFLRKVVSDTSHVWRFAYLPQRFYVILCLWGHKRKNLRTRTAYTWDAFVSWMGCCRGFIEKGKAGAYADMLEGNVMVEHEEGAVLWFLEVIWVEFCWGKVLIGLSGMEMAWWPHGALDPLAHFRHGWCFA